MHTETFFCFLVTLTCTTHGILLAHTAAFILLSPPNKIWFLSGFVEMWYPLHNCDILNDSVYLMKACFCRKLQLVRLQFCTGIVCVLKIFVCKTSPLCVCQQIYMHGETCLHVCRIVTKFRAVRLYIMLQSFVRCDFNFTLFSFWRLILLAD